MGKIEKIQHIIFGIILGVIITLIIFSATQEKFFKTEIQPSSYFNEKLKDGLESENGSIRLIYTNPQELRINFKKDDEFVLGDVLPTKSMYPTLSASSITINLLNFTEEDLHIGDIIFLLSERVEDHSPLINISDNVGLLHRIVDIREINGTTYYQTKGDNLNAPDKILWEFSDIKSKLIGILYIFGGIL